MEERDIINPKALYRYYLSYKYLYDFWEETRRKEAENRRVVTDEEMRSRIQYILKNKVRQRDEIETLCWILGEEDARKNNR